MGCFEDVWAPTALSYFTAVTSVLLLCVIVSGNAAIITAVIKDPLKKLRTPFNFFLVNLAVSDLLVGAITMPLSVKQHLQETTGWKNPIHEKVLHLSYFISATASVFNLSALSVDRLCAIKWPIKYRQRRNLKRYFITCMIIWTASIAISMAYFAVGYIKALMIFIHVAVLITFAILVITYAQVYRVFRRQVKHLKRTASQSFTDASNELGSVRYDKKVTRTLLWILGLFIAAYTPAIIMVYTLHFCSNCHCKFRHSLRDLTFLVVSANSGVNPFVCVIRLKPFRDTLAFLFECCCRPRKGEKYESAEELKRKATTSDAN